MANDSSTDPQAPLSTEAEVDPDDDSTDSNREETANIADEDAAARRRKAIKGEIPPEEIDDPELRERVLKAHEKRNEAAGSESDVSAGEADGAEADDQTRVELSEDSNTDVSGSVSNTTESGDPETVEHSTSETETKTTGSGVMEGVDEEQAEEAMDDISLNVREDIDPEHFDYENQDFSAFGGYADETNVESNGAVFLFVMPDEDTQEEMINSMQMLGEDGSVISMMEMMIEKTIKRPYNIEDRMAEWTPFERLGLGLQVMEFLGVDALGNS